MSRANWTNLALLVGLCVCIVAVVGFDYMQYAHLNRVGEEAKQVDQQVALEDQYLNSLQTVTPSAIGMLAYPASEQEDGEFLIQMRTLMQMASVKPISLDRTPLSTLPSYGKPSTAESTPSSAFPTQDKDKKAKPEPSLTNLPLGVSAISARLTVQGSFPNLRIFLYQLRNYRYHVRALNLNEMQIAPIDDKGNLRATMLLTRFIRPKATTLSPIAASASGAIEAGPVAEPPAVGRSGPGRPLNPVSARPGSAQP